MQGDRAFARNTLANLAERTDERPKIDADARRAWRAEREERRKAKEESPRTTGTDTEDAASSKRHSSSTPPKQRAAPVCGTSRSASACTRCAKMQCSTFLECL